MRAEAYTTPTKLLIEQIISVFATQWAAVELAYQFELGLPWFIAFGRPIYHPIVDLLDGG